MALMTAVETFDILSKKYKDFMVPACKIKVGTSEITSNKDVQLESMKVSLSLENTGCAYFVLHGMYDYENSSFPSFLKKNITIGKIVEISLGYLSDTTLLFKGFIASLDIRFDVDEGIFYEVIAFDARRLMKTDNKPYILHDKENYSNIVMTIMKRYSALCSLSCDSTKDKLKSPVCQRESDYDFIVEQIIGKGKADREFFILADKAYFRKINGGNSKPVIGLGIGKGLKYFKSNSLYLNKKIEIQGYESGGKKPINATAIAKNKNKQSEVITEGLTVIIAEDCDRETLAQSIADNYKKLMEEECLMVQGTCIGMPEIIPGRFLEITKLDSLVNKKYYVTEVTHTLDENGFLTKFNTKG